MMKKLLTLALLMSFGLCKAQNLETNFVCTYGESATPDLLCMEMQRSFSGGSDANEATKKILKVLGLAPNFIMVPCPNIDNCAAVTLNDGFRYIVYDKEFMQNISNTASNDWTSTSILAHEIGHHLQGHTLRRTDNEESRKMELEADRFSGFVLQKLGANLNDAQAAMNALGHPEDDVYSSHPAKWKRLNAIKEGWNDAAGIVNEPTTAPKTEVTDIIDVTSLDVEISDATTLSYHDIIQADAFPMLGDSWNAGYNYKAAVYDYNHWYVFMRKDYGNWQAYRRREYFPKDEIAELWDKNNSVITSLDYYDNEWNLTMTSFGEKFIKQRWATDSDFPAAKIKESWGEGYYITEAAYGEDKWAIVFNKTTNYEKFTNQMYNRYDEFPKDAIKEYWDKGWFVTTLKYLDGQWFLVMTEFEDRNAGNYKQRWNKTTEFPMDKVLKNDSEGLKLQSVTYGDGYWVTVMEKWR
ncbi:MAG: hypothetical protein HWE21_03050 [Cytophagia bacterium]|nr:hypothetical protein [Cytophagia bacterium]